MKKMKLFALGMALVLIVTALTACDSGGKEDPNGKTEVKSALTLEFVEESNKELDAQPVAYNEDAEESLLNAILVTCNEKVTDLSYVRVNVTDAGFEIGETFTTLEELEPGHGWVLGVVFEGDMPTRGITYTDSKGVERFGTLTTSGEDGSLIFEEAAG